MPSSTASSTLPGQETDELDALDDSKADGEGIGSIHNRTPTVPVVSDSDNEPQIAAMEHEPTYDSITKSRSKTRDPEKGPDGTSQEDPNVIWWDGSDDPEDPLNFSPSIKLLNIGLISAICFVTPLASSMFAPGIPDLMVEFKSKSTELGSFVVSVYVLGFAVGPLAFAPMSEMYGRLPIYHVCNVCFLAFTIACALAPSLNSLIVFRFLAGLFGSAPLTNGGGSIADLVEQAKRGKAMSGFAMGPIVGPIIGPVAGGYIAQSLGWRWVFWILTVISGICMISSFFFLRETYAPVLLQRKVNKLQKESGNMELRSKLDSGLTSKDFFLRSIVRPIRLLVLSPVVLSTSLYVGVVYGYLYLMFTTFPLVFERTYHFSAGSVGLTYLGLGVGSLFGVVIFGVTSDRILKQHGVDTPAAEVENDQLSRQNTNASTRTLIKPELRLPMMIWTAPLIPVGLIIYAWTTEYAVHWIVPIIATGLVGVGNIMAFMCISTYLLDAFSVYAASALAANTVIRSIMGAVLPLAGQKMYLKLGLGWGSSLLAFVAFALLPVPIILNRWGGRLRKRWEVKDL